MGKLPAAVLPNSGRELSLPDKTPGEKHVLVVDDDPEWRELLRHCLEEMGYQVCEARNGQQALRFLTDNPCDILLLDFYMPDMTGLEVLERLKEPHPKVVLLTAAEVDSVSPALSKGAHYYLPKGATAEQLSLMMESL